MSNYQQQQQDIYGQQQTPSFLGNVVGNYPSSNRGTHYGQQQTPSFLGNVVSNYPSSSRGTHYGQQQTPSFLGNVVGKNPSSSRGTHYVQQHTPSPIGDVVGNYPSSNKGTHYGQQQTPSLIGDVGAYYPFSSRDTSITDDDLIQQYVDENRQLVLTILEKQKGGKLHECAIYREKLRANLKVLAAIGNAQHFSLASRTQVRSATTMQLQHHALRQLLQSILHNRPLQQQIQMTQPSILGQRNKGTPPTYLQTASRTPIDLLHHVSSTHQHQQFLHGASPNSGYMSTSTCNTSQFDMQAMGSDSLNISSGNNADRPRLSSEKFHDGDLT